MIDLRNKLTDIKSSNTEVTFSESDADLATVLASANGFLASSTKMKCWSDYL